MVHTGFHLKTVIEKASKIVCYVRQSIHATEIFEGEKKLQTPNTTRWNSQLIMIRSVLCVSEEKLSKLDTAHLASHERKVQSEFVKSLLHLKMILCLSKKRRVLLQA